MTTPEARQERAQVRFGLWAALGFVLVLLLVAFGAMFLAINQAGRQADRDARVARCVESSRGSVAHGWFARQAQAARLEDGNSVVARRYGDVAEFWEDYAGIPRIQPDTELRQAWRETESARRAECDQSIPKPKLFG